MEHNKTVSPLSCSPRSPHRRTASTSRPPACCSSPPSSDPPRNKSKPSNTQRYQTLLYIQGAPQTSSSKLVIRTNITSALVRMRLILTCEYAQGRAVNMSPITA
ncbi:hypothetical protein CJ030_MR4G021109 [Morella rubra]|uniref:Uncharacterized protein n=1 Tax=Morella rubra TaxID=262757 RepID=A0A6A1VW68_9ROSI|nr:hypothetical protein CJ030_MR4G021109 [Morella rubra]